MAARRSAIERFLQLSRSNKLALGEALLSLAIASLAIKLIPFRRTVALMPVMAGRTAPADAERDRLIAQCRWAVVTWAARVPWRAVCFQRGFALHLMLRRRGIASVLHYGVSQTSLDGLRAHVWIDAGGRTVMGGAEAPDFQRLASFPAGASD